MGNYSMRIPIGLDSGFSADSTKAGSPYVAIKRDAVIPGILQ